MVSVLYTYVAQFGRIQSGQACFCILLKPDKPCYAHELAHEVKANMKAFILHPVLLNINF